MPVYIIFSKSLHDDDDNDDHLVTRARHSRHLVLLKCRIQTVYCCQVSYHHYYSLFINLLLIDSDA